MVSVEFVMTTLLKLLATARLTVVQMKIPSHASLFMQGFRAEPSYSLS